MSDEIDRELAFHLAERAEELEATGVRPDEAQLEARRRFGSSALRHHVARRRNEIGVRIALGAARSRVVRMVLADVGRLVALGVLMSLAVTRLVSTFLYGVTPHDPATLAFSALALVGVAILAALLPARRAARLDPAAALRED
jgi:putative ABC transport system permease protein